MESAVAGLLKIQRANPEHEAAIQAAVQVMTDQSFTIDALSKALAEVRGQLKALLGDLEVDEESQSAIEVIQGGILTILELLEVNGGTSEQSGGASSTSSSTASPSSSSSSGTHPASSTPQTPPLRASRNGSELKSQLTEVYRLANRDKTEAAREKLAEIPDGKELHIRSIDNAAKAMEDLLLQRGGLSSAHRTLGQLFDRPIVRTIMSDYLKENAPSSDRDTIAAMVESIKAFFTGTMATRGRRTDLNRNVFYAAAAAVIPKDVRENRQMRQSFQVGWIVAKACWCSFVRKRGSTQSPDRAYKELVGDEAFVSMNHLIRLDRPVKHTWDNKQKHWVLPSAEIEYIEGAL